MRFVPEYGREVGLWYMLSKQVSDMCGVGPGGCLSIFKQTSLSFFSPPDKQQISIIRILTHRGIYGELDAKC